jgi:Tfp pilus tip-associated adhesin PilY1
LNGNTARNIKTYKSGLIDFEHNRVSKDDIGLQSGDAWQAVIAYIRGEATPDQWKLGDIFHSNPITIGKPSPYFNDPRDKNNKFAAFRSGQQTRAKIIVAGANDGQLHAFDGDGGSEVWSFIPPNLLGKLKFLAHSSHPTSLPHQFFVDGPISAADIWLGTGDGTAKGDNEWKTYIVFGEGKGVRNKNNEAAPLWSSSESCDSARPEDFSSTYTSDQYKYYCGPYLWSSSPSCDTGFSATYTPAYSHYCGYYALDVTRTGSIPGYGWRINSDPVTGGTDISHGTYLGEPWSRMAIGRVLIGGRETWAGFIGGGYGQSGDAGKGFFVIDLKDGHILWSYTHTNYSIPASPAVVDTDNDGFVDTAYVGNLGGEMWKFTFCTQAQGSSCGTGNWNGGLLFRPSTTRPIFTTAAAARDSRSNLWIFWGTGDKTNPNSSTPGKFFAIKDSGNGTYYESDLPDISVHTDTSRGWSITLGSGGEKMLSDPTVFGGVLLFTTYTPYAGSNPCIKTGTSLLYALAMQKTSIGGKAYNTGAGLLTDPGGSTTRSVSLGLGIASTPIISQRSGGGTPDIFVSVSGGIKEDGTTTTTQPAQIKSNADLNAASPLIQRLAQTAPYTQLLHWKDGRIQ